MGTKWLSHVFPVQTRGKTDPLSAGRGNWCRFRKCAVSDTSTMQLPIIRINVPELNSSEPPENQIRRRSTQGVYTRFECPQVATGLGDREVQNCPFFAKRLVPTTICFSPGVIWSMIEGAFGHRTICKLEHSSLHRNAGSKRTYGTLPAQGSAVRPSVNGAPAIFN
jgi:hypothetical protein